MPRVVDGNRKLRRVERPAVFTGSEDLAPEQHQKVKSFIEDRVEAVKNNQGAARPADTVSFTGG